MSNEHRHQHGDAHDVDNHHQDHQHDHQSDHATVDDEQFEELIGQALDELPQKYVERLLNDVVVTWAYEPDEEQRQKLKLGRGDALYGLYEGVPLTQRYTGGTPILPDKITIFKHPMVDYFHQLPELKEQIKKTVWHEMAHYFGLDHERIHELGD